MIKSQKALNLLILVVFLSLIIITLLGITNKKTGEFILAEGNSLPKSSGNFIFYLHKGEFIPANSSVVFVSGGIAKEFSLKNLVEQKPSNGSFYLKGISLSGVGFGYGAEGFGRVYPKITAKLKISSLFFNGENKEVGGNLSFYKPLLISLSRDEMIKLVKKSVKYEGRSLSDDEVNIKVQKNVAEITTNFYIGSKGYGKNYYENYLVSFPMKSSLIESVLGKSKANVTIYYKNLKLISFGTN